MTKKYDKELAVAIVKAASQIPQLTQQINKGSHIQRLPADGIIYTTMCVPTHDLSVNGDDDG